MAMSETAREELRKMTIFDGKEPGKVPLQLRNFIRPTGIEILVYDIDSFLETMLGSITAAGLPRKTLKPPILLEWDQNAAQVFRITPTNSSLDIGWANLVIVLVANRPTERASLIKLSELINFQGELPQPNKPGIWYLSLGAEIAFDCYDAYIEMVVHYSEAEDDKKDQALKHMVTLFCFCDEWDKNPKKPLELPEVVLRIIKKNTINPCNTVFDRANQKRGAADFLDAEVGTILANFLLLLGHFLGKTSVRSNVWSFANNHWKTPILFTELMASYLPGLILPANANKNAMGNCLALPYMFRTDKGVLAMKPVPKDNLLS